MHILEVNIGRCVPGEMYRGPDIDSLKTVLPPPLSKKYIFFPHSHYAKICPSCPLFTSFLLPLHLFYLLNFTIPFSFLLFLLHFPFFLSSPFLYFPVEYSLAGGGGGWFQI